MKVFLDARVLVRMSTQNESTGAFLALPAYGVDLSVVSSTYALGEALRAAG